MLPHAFLLMKEMLLKRLGVCLQRLKLDAKLTDSNQSEPSKQAYGVCAKGQAAYASYFATDCCGLALTLVVTPLGLSLVIHSLN